MRYWKKVTAASTGIVTATWLLASFGLLELNPLLWPAPVRWTVVAILAILIVVDTIVLLDN